MVERENVNKTTAAHLAVFASEETKQYSCVCKCQGKFLFSTHHAEYTFISESGERANGAAGACQRVPHIYQ